MSKLCDEMPIYEQSDGSYVVFHKDVAFTNKSLELVIIAWGEMLKKDRGWSNATFIKHGNLVLQDRHTEEQMT